MEVLKAEFLLWVFDCVGKKKNKKSAQPMLKEDPDPDPESDTSSGSLGPENDTQFANMLTGIVVKTTCQRKPSALKDHLSRIQWMFNVWM